MYYLLVVSSSQNPFNLCGTQQAESGARRWQLEDDGTSVSLLEWLERQLSSLLLPSGSITDKKKKRVFSGKADLLEAAAYKHSAQQSSLEIHSVFLGSSLSSGPQ